MSSSEPNNRELSDGDELVAYLDGELPPEVNRRVEERLANDADYHQQLRELDQAWEALDVLPRVTVDDDFARTTIEMIAVKAQDDVAVHVAQAATAHRSRRLKWAAVGLVAVAAGFTAASLLLPNYDQRLLKDLPVIRQVDLLSQISDIAFLRELSQKVPPEQLTRDAKALNKELEAIHSASAPSLEDRDRWVRQLSPEEKQDVWAQENRFFDNQERTPQDRQQLRELEHEIATAPDAEQLQKTLIAFSQFLAAPRRPSDQAALRERKLPDHERVAKIQQLVQNEGKQASRQLSAVERTKLKAEIRAITDEHKEAMLKDASRETSRNIDELRQFLSKQRSAEEFVTVFWALNPERNPEIAADTRKRLLAQLDPENMKFADSREATRDSSRRGGFRPLEPLHQWISEELLLRTNHNPQDLMRYFAEKLTNDQKATLANLPPAEFETKLIQWYDADQLDLRDLNWFGGFRFGPGGGRRGQGPDDGQRGGRGRRGGGQFGPFGEGQPPSENGGEIFPARGRGTRLRGAGQGNRGESQTDVQTPGGASEDAPPNQPRGGEPAGEQARKEQVK